MSKSSVLVLLVAVTIALCGIGFGQAQQQDAPRQAANWEYNVIQLPEFDQKNLSVTSARLNDIAADGWELHEYHVVGRTGMTTPIAIFKRPLADAAR